MSENLVEKVKIAMERIRTSSEDEKLSKKIIDKIKKFFKFPSKDEAKKIVENASNKDIQEAYDLIPKILKFDFSKKESISFDEIKKKALLLAAITVLSGGTLVGCGKQEPPSKPDILRYSDMEVTSSDFEPTDTVFEYIHELESGPTVIYKFRLTNNRLSYFENPEFLGGVKQTPELKKEAEDFMYDLARDMISVKDILREEYIGDVKNFTNMATNYSDGFMHVYSFSTYYTSPISKKRYYLEFKDGASPKGFENINDIENYAVKKGLMDMFQKRKLRVKAF